MKKVWPHIKPFVAHLLKFEGENKFSEAKTLSANIQNGNIVFSSSSYMQSKRLTLVSTISS